MFKIIFENFLCSILNFITINYIINNFMTLLISFKYYNIEIKDINKKHVFVLKIILVRRLLNYIFYV